MATLTPRAREVLERVQSGQPASAIAKDLDVSRNAVYQHIGKLRRDGYLPAREPQAEDGLSVDQTLDDLKLRLKDQLERIDARTLALTQELEHLRKERSKVEEMLSKFEDE